MTDLIGRNLLDCTNSIINYQLPEHMYYASAQALRISLIKPTYCKMYIEHALHCTLYLKDQSSVS